MKYPTINKEKLDSINRKKFDFLKGVIKESIKFDNTENKLGLSEGDTELLSWNITTNIITESY